MDDLTRRMIMYQIHFNSQEFNDYLERKRKRRALNRLLDMAFIGLAMLILSLAVQQEWSSVFTSLLE